jgi:FkbM family methyltransferase
VTLRERFLCYYSLFGWHGAFLAAESRLFSRPIEVSVAVPAVKHPVYIRLRTSDVLVVWQVLVSGRYDWQFAKSPKVIVDAGANVGLASIYYANRYPEARIIAVEPELSNYEILKKNVAPYPQVVPVRAALWKENTDLLLIDRGTGHYGFRTVEATTSACKIRGGARGLTLDTLMAECHVDFIDILKVDIEGAEKEVFEHTSAWVGKIGAVVVELHDNTKTGCSRSVYQATQGFEFEWRKGETIFLLKPEYVGPDSPPLGVPFHHPHCGTPAPGVKLPFKIIARA